MRTLDLLQKVENAKVRSAWNNGVNEQIREGKDMITEIREHKGDYKNFYLSIYYENIDERSLQGVTKVIITPSKKIIWKLY